MARGRPLSPLVLTDDQRDQLTSLSQSTLMPHGSINYLLLTRLVRRPFRMSCRSGRVASSARRSSGGTFNTQESRLFLLAPVRHLRFHQAD